MSKPNKNTFWQNLWNPPIRVPTKRKKKKEEEDEMSSSTSFSSVRSPPKEEKKKEKEKTSSSTPFSSVRSPPKEAKEKEEKKTPVKRIPSQDAVLSLTPPPKPANIWSWMPVWSRKPMGMGQAQPKSSDPPKATQTLPPSPDPLKATETLPPSRDRPNAIKAVLVFPNQVKVIRTIPTSTDPLKATKTRPPPPDPLKAIKTRSPCPDPPKVTQTIPPSLDPLKATKTIPPSPDPLKTTKTGPSFQDSPKTRPPPPDQSKTPANLTKHTSSTPFKDKPNISKDVPQKADTSREKPAPLEVRAKALAPFEHFLLKVKDHFKQDTSQPTSTAQNTDVSMPETSTPKTPTAATAKKPYLNRKVQFLMDPETYNVPKDQGKPQKRRAGRINPNPWRKYLVIAEIHKQGGYVLGPGNTMTYIVPGTAPPPPPMTPNTDGNADEKSDEFTDATERDDHDTQLLVTSDIQPKKETVIPHKVPSEAAPIKRKQDIKKVRDRKRKVKSKSVREMRTRVVEMGTEAVKTGTLAVKTGAEAVKPDTAAVKKGAAVVKPDTAVVKTDTPVEAPKVLHKGIVEPVIKDGTLDTNRDVMTDIVAPTVCEEPKQLPKKVMPNSGKKKEKMKSKITDDLDYY